MARNDDSPPESFASPAEVEANEDLPGELLAEDLVEPEPYLVTADEAEAEELDAATSLDDPSQLDQATSVAAVARSSRPQRRAVQPAAKDAETPRNRRRAVAGTPARTTPAAVVHEAAEALRQVVWPTATQVRQYYWVVLAFVVAIIVFVGSLDLAFGWALLKLFG